jgi:hypothetical protein
MLIRTRITALAIASLALACVPSPPVDAGDDDAGVPTADAGAHDAGPIGPILVVTPPSCDFGLVPVNTSALCEVTLANTGDRDVAIDVFRFSDDTPVAMDPYGNFDTSLPGFGSQTIVFLPFFIGPGTEATVRLFAHPPTVGTVTGTLVVASGDDVHELLLKVTGDDAAHAAARVASVNNEEPLGGIFIKPLDDVVLSADESLASMSGGHITSFEWWIAEKPATSTVQLTTPAAMTTRFHFDSSGGQVSGIDVAGTYRIGLLITDAAGLVGEAELEFIARFDVGLAIELTWDSPNYDYDLHVIKGSVPWCSASSCYYANCNANSAFVTLPEWDGVAGETTGDPRLVIDDLSGYGPEQISVEVPVDAVYRVGVHAYSFSVSSPVWATIKIFVHGALAYEDTRDVSSGQSFWEPAEIDWWNGDATVYPLNVFHENGWSCGVQEPQP